MSTQVKKKQPRQRKRGPVGAGADADAGAAAGAARADEINEVILVGRVSRPPECRTLPSGTVMWSFRVVVGRPVTPDRRVHVDAIDCVVWSKRPARTVASWVGGEVVEVHGSLRRRFFAPAGGGRVSRTEVEVGSLRTVRRAAG